MGFSFPMRLTTIQGKAWQDGSAEHAIYRKNAQICLAMVNYRIVIIDRKGSSLRALAPEAEGSGCSSRAMRSSDVCWRGAGHAFQQHRPLTELCR